ncbi:MAG: hypothetical protein ACREXV_03160 [Polaromonas sp.]
MTGLVVQVHPRVPEARGNRQGGADADTQFAHVRCKGRVFRAEVDTSDQVQILREAVSSLVAGNCVERIDALIKAVELLRADAIGGGILVVGDQQVANDQVGAQPVTADMREVEDFLADASSGAGLGEVAADAKADGGVASIGSMSCRQGQHRDHGEQAVDMGHGIASGG